MSSANTSSAVGISIRGYHLAGAAVWAVSFVSSVELLSPGALVSPVAFAQL